MKNKYQTLLHERLGDLHKASEWIGISFLYFHGVYTSNDKNFLLMIEAAASPMKNKAKSCLVLASCSKISIEAHSPALVGHSIPCAKCRILLFSNSRLQRYRLGMVCLIQSKHYFHPHSFIWLWHMWDQVATGMRAVTWKHGFIRCEWKTIYQVDVDSLSAVNAIV